MVTRRVARIIGDCDQSPVGVIDIAGSQCRLAAQKQSNEPGNTQPDTTPRAEIEDRNSKNRIQPTSTSYDAVLRNVHILWSRLLVHMLSSNST